MKTYRIISLGILFLLFQNSSLAQAPLQIGDFADQLNIKSPQTADFSKFGNIQTKKHFGLLDLSIPIASVNIGGFSESVSLSYNSSGFMPNKRDGIIGMGWYLNAGGAITRTVRGVPDEHEGHIPSNNLHGLYYAIKEFGPLSPSESDIFNFSSSTGEIDSYTLWQRTTGSPGEEFESEPDMFHFNFHGISGSFFINNQGGVEVISNQQTKIEVDLTNFALQDREDLSIPLASQIVLKLDNGYTYYFGRSASTSSEHYMECLEFTVPINSPLSSNSSPYTVPSAVINTWNLTKVVSPYGKEMTYSYEGIMENSTGYIEDKFTTFNPGGNYEEFLTANYLNEYRPIILNKYVSEIRNHNTQAYSNNLGTNISYDGGSIDVDSRYEISKLSYLRNIETNDFSFGFVYRKKTNVFYNDPNELETQGTRLYNFIDKKLEKINVKTKNDGAHVVFSKHIELVQSVIGDRIFLTDVIDLGDTTSSTDDAVYSFEYHNTSNLPDPDTRDIDHWGFWTGGNNKHSDLIPVFTYNMTTGDQIYGASGDIDNRAPSSSLYNVSLLKKITYPTGGYSEFTYEAHKYKKRLNRVSANDFHVGVETLSNDELAGGARIKEIKDYDGDGFSNTRTFYYSVNYSPTNTNDVSSGLLLNWPRYFYYIELVLSGSTSKLYRFRSSSFNRNSYDGFHMTYGEVTEVLENDAYNTSYFSTYETNPDIDEIGGIPQWKEKNIHPLLYSTTFSSITPVNLYKNYVGQQFNDTSIERGKLLSTKNYSALGDIVSEKELVYNTDPNRFNDYVTQIHHSGGFWVQSIKRYIYPNFVTQEKTKTYSQNGIAGDFVEQIVDYQYNYDFNKLVSKQVTGTNQSTLQTLYKYPFDLYCSTTGSGHKYWEMTNANLINFPVEIINKRDNLVTSAIVNDYSHAGNKVYLNYTKSYENASLGTSYAPLSVDSYCDLDEDPNLKTKVTYDLYDSDGNIRQYHTEEGIPVTAIWGYGNTRLIAKVENAEYNDILSAITTHDIVNKSDDDNSPTGEDNLRTALNNFRNDSLLADAFVTTYTYDTEHGLTSITDPRGRTIYYFYDDFHRLIQVKDHDGYILNESQYNYKQ